MNNFGLGILIQAKDQASAVFQKVENRFDSLSRKSDQLASRMQMSSKAFYAGVGLMGAGASILGGLAYATNEAAKFSASIGDSMTMTNLAGKEYDIMKGKMMAFADELSSKLGVSAEEINKGFYQTLSAGVEPMSADFKELTETGTMLSRLLGTEVSVTIESLSDTCHAFGLKITEVRQIADGFFRASMLGSTTVPQLTEAMRAAAPTAGSMGVSFADTSAILTAWASKGIKGAEAGTAFKSVLVRLMDSQGRAKKGWEALTAATGKHVQLYDPVTKKARNMIDILTDMQGAMSGLNDQQRVAIIRQIFGAQMYAQAIALLTSNTKTMRQWSNEIAKGGVINKAYEEKMKGFNMQMQLLKTRFHNFIVAVGLPLLQILTPFIKRISEVVSRIGEWAQKNQALVATIAKFMGVVGILLVVGGAILTILGAVGMLSVGLASLPMAAGAIGSVAAGILPLLSTFAAFIALGYLIYKAWTTNFMGIRSIVLPILQALKAGFSSFMKAHGDTVMAFAGVCGKIVFAILAVVGAIRLVKSVVSTATTVWRTGAMGIRFMYYGFLQARAYASYYGQAILSAARNTLAFARAAAVQAVQGLKRLALSLAAAVRQAALFAVSLIKQAVTAVVSFATSLATSAVAAIGSFIAALIPAIAAAWAFTAALLANPITWIVIAIVALIVIIILLIKNWDKVKAVVIRVWNIVVAWIKTAVDKIKTFFIGIYHAVVDAFSRAWVWLRDFIIKWWPFILGVFTGGIGLLIGLIIQNWGQIMAFLQGIGMAIRNWIAGVVNWIRMRWEMCKAAVVAIWNAIQSAVSWAINAVRNVVSGVIASIQFRWHQFRSVVSGVWHSISATISGVVAGIRSRVQGVISFITGLWTGLKTAVAGVWNWIVQKISGAIATIKNKMLGLIPGWLRTALSYIGINIPAPSKKGEAYATGGYVAKTGGISATLHEGEVITPAPAVRKIVRFADMIPAGGIPGGTGQGNVTHHFSPQIHISLPNVKEIDRQSVEELANLIIKKIEYLQKRKREAGFSNDFNPALAVAKS